ncbi:unnamed protein product [Microthlaspi erraticum]|uniref:Cullin family profile domain-containing protein n=1 Tax=Microthlaspi erraticum TaxID=1685480 RepID=A0A6D2LJ06_9BRAS|nr:unnamed protein product [Microthlaspi erraticum]
MYRLYQPIAKGLEPVADVFKQHVTAEGNALIKQAEDAATSGGVQDQVLVTQIMELHDKYMDYVTKSFQSHTLFHKALKEAFEVFCNKNVAGSSSAELLATDKDLFAEFYRKKQARRLLFDRSGGEEHESSLLTKLKQQLGGQFTSKMEGMVTDMTLAKDSQLQFEAYLNTCVATKPGIDMTVTVLTTGFWPSYKTSDLNLPSEMINCIQVFKAYYELRTSHRRLVWIYSLGTCHVVGRFSAKPIELIVSTYQAAVLLLFNNTERLKYNEIVEQLNLTHEDLVRLLHSLSCAKYKILKKEPMSKTISRTDVFEFNSHFTDK